MISKMMHAYTAAAASTSILESMSAYYGTLETRGVTRDTLIETCSCMLYQTVTGRPPFTGRTALDTIKKSLSDPPVPPTQFNSNLSDDFVSVINKAMEKKPEDRFENCKQMAAALSVFYQK